MPDKAATSPLLQLKSAPSPELLQLMDRLAADVEALVDLARPHVAADKASNVANLGDDATQQIVDLPPERLALMLYAAVERLARVEDPAWGIRWPHSEKVQPVSDWLAANAAAAGVPAELMRRVGDTWEVDGGR